MWEIFPYNHLIQLWDGGGLRRLGCQLKNLTGRWTHGSGTLPTNI